MTGTHWFVVAIGAGILALPSWWSVTCLIQARQLLRWRRPSLEGLDGQPVALRGEVRVREPLKPWTIGDCLWNREVTQIQVDQYEGSTTAKTLTDLACKAGFSIVIEGLECVIADLPTQV